MNKKTYGLISYVDFDRFHCSRCGNFKEIFVGTTSASKKHHVCHLCGARFDLLPARLEDGAVVMPCVFRGFECKNCGELLPPEAMEGTNFCPKCRDDERWSLHQEIKDLRQRLSFAEGALAKLETEQK